MSLFNASQLFDHLKIELKLLKRIFQLTLTIYLSYQLYRKDR